MEKDIEKKSILSSPCELAGGETLGFVLFCIVFGNVFFWGLMYLFMKYVVGE